MTHVNNGSDDPVENDNGETHVSCCPPREEKRSVEGNLTPVECENTHGQSVCDAEQLIDHTIVGSYPADPGKAGESGKEIGGQEVYDNNQSGFKVDTFHFPR